MKITKRTDRDGWQVRWRENGVQRGRLFTRKADADDFVREFERRRLYGLPSIDAGRVTLSEFVEEWWRTYAVPNLKPRTRAVYAQTWDRHIRLRLGGYQLREITPAVLEDFRAQLHAAGAGDPTVIKAMALLQGILKRAVVRGLLMSNPMLVVDKPRQARPRRFEPLDPATIEAIRDNLANPRDRLLVSLMGYQGLRPDEATRVKVADLADRTVFVHARKTGRDRYVDLLAPVVAELREYQLITGIRQGLLSPSVGGREWTDSQWRNWRKRVYQPAAIAAGVTVDMRPYRLRGSFGSLLLWEGRSVAYVAEQMGHDVATFAAHYAGVLRELEDRPRVPAADAILDARERRRMVRRA